MTPHDEHNDRAEVQVTPGDSPRPTWTFQMEGRPVGWIWQQSGSPPIDRLEPVRKPSSSKRNRHIPVTAYSTTNDAMVLLESGLEHDLVRRIDRDPAVVRLVPQPFRLTWKSPAMRHTPDLLSEDASGIRTVWDVRATEDQDHDFDVKSNVTKAACTAVGWQYKVFAGLDPTERLNLLWLHGFRRRPPWAETFERTLLRAAEEPGTTLGALLARDEGSGELKSTVWHLLWSGAVFADLRDQWTESTPVHATPHRAP